MVEAQKKLKWQDLADRAIGLSDDADNTFALASIEREANALKPIDTSHASEVLAIVAFKRRQYDKMREHFRNAELTRPADPLLDLNMSGCLRTGGFFQESLERLNKVINRFRDDKKILKEALLTYRVAPDMENAATVLDWLQKLGVNTNDTLDDLRRHCELLARRGISTSDLVKRHEAVAQLLREKQLETQFVSQEIRHDASVRLVHDIIQTPRQAAQLNMEIAELLAYTFEDTLSDVMMITTNPSASTGTRQDAAGKN